VAPFIKIFRALVKTVPKLCRLIVIELLLTNYIRIIPTFSGILVKF